MINWLRKKISKRQKHNIKYLIAFFSISHIRSVINLFSYTLNSEKKLNKTYQLLHPKVITESHRRVGGYKDGGYLIPDIEHRYDGLISPGVGDSVRFETEFVGSDGLAVLIDATVPKPSGLPANMIFLQKMLAGERTPDDLFVTLEDIRNCYFSNSQSLALQMDIEGAEYEIFANMKSQDFVGFDLLLVEFHNLHQILESRGKINPLEDSINLLGEDFHLTHTHPNNAGGFFLNAFRVFPKVVETTWVRKKLVTPGTKKADLPHPLDVPNDPLIWNLNFPSS